MTNSQKPNYTFALTVMVVLMFLLGFITTMNNSMIAFCTKAFSPLVDVELQVIISASRPASTVSSAACFSWPSASCCFRWR